MRGWMAGGRQEGERDLGRVCACVEYGQSLGPLICPVEGSGFRVRSEDL